MMKKYLPSLFILSTLTACASPEPVELNWLSGSPPTVEQKLSWGTPWPEGACTPQTSFALNTAAGEPVPVASWPLAYWPDGSLKWSGHAALASANISSGLLLKVGEPAVPRDQLVIDDAATELSISTGPLRCVLNKSGAALFQTLEIDGVSVGGKLRPVGYVQNGPSDDIGNLENKVLSGRVLKTVLEQQNAVRAVVRMEGEYEGGFSKNGIIPFSVRLYFYAGSSSVRIVYTIRYEGNDRKDYIRGLGLKLDVPLRTDAFNRHVLFAGEGDGVWHEPVRMFTARTTRLEPDKDGILREQLNGKPLLPPSGYGEKREKIIKDIALWDGFKLVQTSADSFSVHKRTGRESSWLKSDWGGRARGTAFVGDTSGGVVWGLRDFWQTCPSAFEINGMTGDQSEMTLWLWPPDGPAMDLRHYDVKGHGLNAAYEDYEEGHATPYGVARTFEMTLEARSSVPANETFSELADAVAVPALPVCSPEYYHSIPVFGRWSLPDTSMPSKQWVEERLTILLDYLQHEIENHRWYGFWDYGDVMHQYDTVRHRWKYDVGGFAWANTELVPNLWLWTSFLRSGDPDVFRMAEAMTRHTSEVDIYHSGPLKGLGSRHNVSHWGGGAKEVRISLATLHRPYYYLTADERIGDVMDSVKDNEEALLRLNPLRKVADKTDWPTQARIGPDWFALAGNWFTAWERTGDVRYRNKIQDGIDSILSLPYQLFTGPYLNYDPATGAFGLVNGKATAEATHMASIFGGAELMFELNDQLNNPAWNQAWIEFCERYTWSSEDWKTHGLTPPKIGAYPGWHARLTAFAADQKKDPETGVRAWYDFIIANDPGGIPTVPRSYSGSVTLNPGQEMDWGSINHMSQWSLNAIELLELAGDQIPDSISDDAEERNGY